MVYSRAYIKYITHNRIKKMDTPLQVIIPMAGLGSRFTDYGFIRNKYMLPINKNHTSMIEMAITTLQAPPSSHFIFILREENPTQPDTSVRGLLQDICTKNKYKCTILSVNALTEGPTCTSYIAKDIVNNDIPLIISNSDQILDWDCASFLSAFETCDAGVLTYTPDYPIVIGSKDKHSFVQKDPNTQQPIRFVEKIAISDEALVGVHYYKKGAYFVEAAKYTFDNNIRAPNGEFYLSYTYQALLNLNYTVGTYKLPETFHFYPVGEPHDYFAYYNKHAPIHIEHPVNKNSYFPTPFELHTTSLGIPLHVKQSFGIILTGDYSIHDRILPNNTYIKPKTQEIILLLHDIDTSAYTTIDDYIRGWLIGDFIPSIVRTSAYEVGISRHKKGEHWGFHYHHELDEYNILLSGKMYINNRLLESGDYFMIPKDIIACPKFVEDCTIVCLKSPSKPKDKIII